MSEGPRRPADGGASAKIERMYYRIGEAAQIVGVQPHVLRYWQSEFRSIRPFKSASGQRVYSRRDIETLLKVKSLLKEQGYTIEGARKRLREGGLEPSRAAEPAGTAEGPDARLREVLGDVRGDIVAFLERLESGE